MGMSVAIVDDDESFCRSLGRMLRQVGVRSTAFLSAEEFLASPLQRGFGCLLLDVELSGMSGLGLHRYLLSDGYRTPVIYITGQGDPGAEAAARRNGCAGFFHKSDAGIRIIDALRQIGREPGEQ